MFLFEIHRLAIDVHKYLNNKFNITNFRKTNLYVTLAHNILKCFREKI